MATIGVISDTHGLLRPQVRAHLADCTHIIHAGDLDNRETLQRLTAMGNLTVVRGNCDRGPWSAGLPDVDLVTVEGHAIAVVHDLEHLTPEQLVQGPQAAALSVVVFGHTHVPHNEFRNGILYFNPGSAGPPRYGKPIGMGKLHIERDRVRGELIVLDCCGQ